MPKTEINRFLGIGQNTIESDHIFLALKRGDETFDHSFPVKVDGPQRRKSLGQTIESLIAVVHFCLSFLSKDR